MTATLHHALLGLSVAALWGAGVRVATLAAPRGLERAVAAAVLAAALAVVEALALGLIGLGTDAAALSAAACLTWLAARLALPSRAPGPLAELSDWFRNLPPAARLAAAGLAGAGLAWVTWLLRYPALGFDASVYHYAEIAAWVREGTPGSIEPVNRAFPVGNYPLTGEVLVAWAAGIARSFVPLSLWSPAAYVLLGAAGWLGLRELKVPRSLAIMALTAVLASPWLVRELNEPLTDLASLTWLVSCAALCAASRRRPALLAPAIVAAGLAVGTKTTAAVPVALVLFLALTASRRRLRDLRPALVAACAVAVAAGGVWYLRNLVQHGSPSWPFVTFRWGDPAPPFVDLLDVRFLERPLDTLDGRSSLYGEFLAGGLVVMAAALAAPLVARERGVAIAAGATALGLLAWASAPVTGLARSPLVEPPGVWSLSTTRYLLPVVATGAVALVLAARVGRAGRALAAGALIAAIVWSLAEDLSLGLPYVPSAATLVLGALAGASAGVLIPPLLSRLPRPRIPAVAVTAICGLAAAAAGAVLARPADGYIERHGAFEQSSALAGRRLAGWFVTQPGFDGDGRRVSTVGRFLSAQLAGERFQHTLELLPADASCRLVEKRARQGWVVITRPDVARGVFGVEPVPAARCRPTPRPLYDDGLMQVYSAAR